VIARIRRTIAWELFNIAWLPLVVFGVLGAPATPTNLAGFGATAALLATGAAYWMRKVGGLRHGRRHLTWRAFRTLRRPAIAMVAIVLPATFIGVLRMPGAGSWPGFAFAVLALAEYVNYFHRQLMYDSADDLRWLLRNRYPRRAHLALDIDRDRRQHARRSRRPA
jgi:hypothetical protein